MIPYYASRVMASVDERGGRCQEQFSTVFTAERDATDAGSGISGSSRRGDNQRHVPEQFAEGEYNDYHIGTLF